jgi:WD40 repeat protein
VVAGALTEARPARYDGFISYSHGPDAPIAAALEDAIRKFARPLSPFRRNPVSIFRDQTNLSASPHLWNAIATSLEESRYLILVASPEAAKSKWVQKELCAWLTRGACSDPRHFDPTTVDPDRRARLLFAVTSGEVEWDDAAADFNWDKTKALPGMLSKVFDGEPLWVDLTFARTASRPLDRTNPDFMAAAARLAAPVRNLPLETLIGLDQREQQRRLRYVAGSAFALLVLSLAALGFAWFYFRTSGQLAVTNRDLEIRQAQMLVSQGTLISEWPPTRALPASDREIIGRTIQDLRASPDVALDSSQMGMLLYARGLDAYTRLGIESPETIETLARLRWRMPRIQAAWPQPEAIGDIAVSPDGKLVAVASGRVARVLERASGRALTSWSHPTTVTIVRFSPNGDWLATGSGDRFLRVWDIRRPDSQDPFIEFELPVNGPDESDDADYGRIRYDEADHSVSLVEFSADGRFLAAAHGNTSSTAKHEVHLLDCATRRPRPLIELPALPTVLAFSSKGTYLAVGTSDGDVLLIRAGTFRPVATLKSGATRSPHVSTLAFTRDETLLAAGGNDSAVRIWKTANATVAYTLQESSAILSVAFSPDASRIAAAVEDSTVRVYRLGPNTVTAIAVPGVPHRVAYSPRGTALVAGIADGSVRAWSAETYTEILRMGSPGGRFTFATDDRLMLAGDAADRVITIDPDEQGAARMFAGDARRTFRERYFDPDANALVEHEDLIARWLSVDSGAEIARAPVLSRSSGSGWSEQDGVIVAPAAPSQEEADVVRLRNGQIERVRLTPTPRGRPMAIDRRRSRVALPLNDTSIGVWDMATGTLIGEYAFTRSDNNDGSAPWALALDDDGTRLAMVNRATVVWLWTIGASNPAPRTLAAGKENLFTIAFVPGSGHILAGDSHATFVFDGQTGARRCAIPHRPNYEELSVSSSGTYLIVLTGGEQEPLVATAHRLTQAGCPAGGRFDLGIERPVAVAVSRSGTVAAIATDEKTPDGDTLDRLHVIDFEGSRKVMMPLTRDSAPRSVAFSKDDRFVITANFAGFRFWPWRTADILEDARARAVVKP